MKSKHTEHKSPDGVTSTISPAKRRVFTLVMLLSPFVLLFTLEFTLRFLNYGGNLSLITKKIVGGKEFYSINRSVGRRYFAQPGAIVPEPADDRFEIKKAKNTKRIFCLGESTMAGFPYEFHATAPSFMRDRLKVLLPQYNIEVINVGLSAVGTYVVQDFLDELLSYEPDLFIVYVGHNEFYGVYGVGSSINTYGGTWMTHLNITLQKARMFLLARDGYFWLRRHLITSDQRPSQSLMGQMVGNQTIPLHSDVYATAKEIFHDNLVHIIETAQGHHVPIIFSTLVSNWRGQKPFVSLFDTKTSPEQQSAWQTFVAGGDSSVSRGNFEEAVQSYSNAIRIDSMNATAFFSMGTTLYSLSRYDEAKTVLIRAKDLDALRFRATVDFENELTAVCAQYKVPVARVDSAFIEASAHGILDNKLLLEHLHPNVNGYFLMAKTFCRAIEQNTVLVPASDWSRESEPMDSVLMELSMVTEFDRTIGSVKIDLLKHRWPFVTGPVNYEFVPTNPVESVVFRMMKGGMAWSEARYMLAEFYARNKQFDLARKECLAVAKVIPFNYEPLLRYADYFNQEGRKEEAKSAYQRCFETDDNPFARMKYAVLLLEEERASAAAAQIEIAFTIDEKGTYKLPAQGTATARYLLGVANAKMGKVGSAKENLQRALAIEPGYQEAQELLTQLSRQQ